MSTEASSVAHLNSVSGLSGCAAGSAGLCILDERNGDEAAGRTRGRGQRREWHLRCKLLENRLHVQRRSEKEEKVGMGSSTT